MIFMVVVRSFSSSVGMLGCVMKLCGGTGFETARDLAQRKREIREI